jgi:hypothetical protein
VLRVAGAGKKKKGRLNLASGAAEVGDKPLYKGSSACREIKHTKLLTLVFFSLSFYFNIKHVCSRSIGWRGGAV